MPDKPLDFTYDVVRAANCAPSPGHYSNCVPMPAPVFQRPPFVYEYPAYRAKVLEDPAANMVSFASCNSFAEMTDKWRDATLTWEIRGWNGYDNTGRSEWVASWAHALGLFITWSSAYPEVTIYRKEDPHTPVLVFKMYGSKT